MKILITGGAGFIGSALIRVLLNTTSNNIINIDKLTYAGNLDSLRSVSDHSNYSFKKIDICDESKLKKLFFEYKPNLVMHLAAESHVDNSILNPRQFIDTNIIGTFNLLEISRQFYASLDKSDKIKFKFHHISTDEVFGDLDSQKSYFTEETSYAPSSPYSASKASSDHLVRAWGRTYGLPYIITNCSNNYGPFQFPEKLIPRMILNAIHGRPLPIYGDGMQIRDWLYVTDHAEALIKVALSSKINDTYNIGGHNEKTNIEVVENICELLDELSPNKPGNLKSYKDLITFVKDRPGHDTRYAIDASKIEKDLNWLPNESFKSGLHKTVKWYLNNSNWWKRVFSGEYRSKIIGEKNDKTL